MLHRASQQLSEAAMHRKSLMEMVAHDLRAPLMAARLSLDLMLNSEQSASIATESQRITAIKDNLNRLIGLLEDLLTIDQLEAGKLHLNLDLANIRTLVDESFQLVHALSVSKDVVLLNEAGTSTIVGDGPRLVQVLTNLLANAIQHSPPKSTVRVQSVLEPHQLKVLIIDSGQGIAAESQAGLFEKFSQPDRKPGSKGFGLGLAISKLIVTEHGGTIGVESSAGNGAKFWFAIPLDDET